MQRQREQEELYTRENKLDLAKKYCEKSLSAGNNNALVCLGGIAEKQGDIKLAESYYKKASENGIAEGGRLLKLLKK